MIERLWSKLLSLQCPDISIRARTYRFQETGLAGLLHKFADPYRNREDGLERRARVDDFICGHNRTGVVWNIDFESGVHRFIRVVRGRVFYHRNLVAKLSGKANSCLHARVCYEPHDDELVDVMRFERQIQIGVGKATGTPMLERHDLARLRFEFAADLATPRAVFEDFSQPGCLLNRRNVLPGLVVGIDDAAHRKYEAPPSAQHSGLATYEEHNYLLLQHPSRDPTIC